MMDLEQSAEKLKALRKQAGMTQPDFADFLTIPVRTLQGWESGRRKPAAYIVRLVTRIVENEL